jgi:hypothetical protein
MAIPEFKIEPIETEAIEVQGSDPKPVEKFGIWSRISKFMKLRYLLFFALSVLAVVLVIFFVKRGSFSDGGVDFKIEGPSEITAGGLIEYKITYKNNNKIAVEGVRLLFFYPPDAVALKEDSATSLINENFDIGKLESGQSGETKIKSYLVGDLGNIKTARAVLVFTPSKDKTEFKKEFSLATTITSLAVPITLLAPVSTTNGQTAKYSVRYENSSGEDLKDLKLKLTYPQGFSFKSSSPNPSSTTGNFNRQDVWNITSLKNGDGAEIAIQGTLSGQERESKKISLVLQRKVSLPSGDVFVDFEKTEAVSTISTPILSLAMKINGEADYIAHLGDKLDYKLDFRNNNEDALSGLSIAVKLDGSMYDLSTLETDGSFDGKANTITWTGSANSLLGDLGPNQSGSVFFKIKLKSSFGGSSGAKDSFVKASANIETTNIPAGIEAEKISADTEITTRLSSSPTFTQKLLINEMVLSPNQFPPKVNKKTSFAVKWNITNPGNPLVKAQVTATLNPGVSWVGNADVSGSTTVQPVFDSKRDVITWDLGSIDAGSGNLPIQSQVEFQISITPSINQVGNPVDLLKNVRFDATDAFTNEKISRTIRDITTTNIDDSQASGLVIE